VEEVGAAIRGFDAVDDFDAGEAGGEGAGFVAGGEVEAGAAGEVVGVHPEHEAAGLVGEKPVAGGVVGGGGVGNERLAVEGDGGCEGVSSAGDEEGFFAGLLADAMGVGFDGGGEVGPVSKGGDEATGGLAREEVEAGGEDEEEGDEGGAADGDGEVCGIVAA
jgi:hypothetical protein